jgi:hypothetical protein
VNLAVRTACCAGCAWALYTLLCLLLLAFVV